MADLNTFIEKENVLPKAELPHFFNEVQFKGAYNFSISCTKFLDDFYLELLEIRRTWNFLNPSPWFLESIKDHIEFVPDLLLDLLPDVPVELLFFAALLAFFFVFLATSLAGLGSSKASANSATD